MVSIDVPNGYGWVILGAGVAPFIVSTLLSGQVMKARKEFDVKYPNLYAVPGLHKKADEFNRVQRGHQNFLENVGTYQVLTLLGGLKYPIPCAGGTILFLGGSWLYLIGYSDVKLDVKTARYKKGGAIKHIGLLISLSSACALGYSLITEN